MRITFSSGQAATMADLESAASNLTRRQREVSSGKRIQAPSDDPTAWAAGVRERSEIASVDQFARSADSATSRLTVADTVLSDLITTFTSARASVVAGQGTIQTASQREATAKELEGLRDAVFDDLNTTFRGTYLFSGGKGLDAPFVRNPDGSISGYQGDSSSISVDVDRTRAVRVSFDGSELAQGTAAEDVFATFAKVIAAVRSGDQAAMADGLKALEAAFDRVVRVQSGVGADLNALDDQRARLGEMKLASQTRLSKTEDANMAESITGMQQANTAYQSALSAVATRTRLSLLDYLK
jgi:flagellar hook-associated protein 3 FlgL